MGETRREGEILLAAFPRVPPCASVDLRGLFGPKMAAVGFLCKIGEGGVG